MHLFSTPSEFLETCSLGIPRHVAIIMDGNRRWAKQKGFPVLVGYWKGADNLTRIVRAASEMGIKILTVYAFSTENWNRSPEEVSALLHLFKIYLKKQQTLLIKEGISLHTIGNLKKFPRDLQNLVEEVKQTTSKGTKMQLVLALNYGGRDDICRAVKKLISDKSLENKEITEQLFGQYLDTALWPDPDVLIRTSGEKRQSNFLLWQLSYSEFYYTEALWPDFDEEELSKALSEYQIRNRRFGLSSEGL